jgi:hypothetical protein
MAEGPDKKIAREIARDQAFAALRLVKTKKMKRLALYAARG